MLFVSSNLRLDFNHYVMDKVFKTELKYIGYAIIIWLLGDGSYKERAATNVLNNLPHETLRTYTGVD